MANIEPWDNYLPERPRKLCVIEAVARYLLCSSQGHCRTETQKLREKSMKDAAGKKELEEETNVGFQK